MDDKLIGKFIRTIYESDTYMVAKFMTEDGSITVTGPFFEYDSNQKYELSGTYVEHYKYGHQFNITSINKCLPNNKEEIINFLSSDLFKGIGKKIANKIYDYFKEDTINILHNNIELVDELNISDKLKQSIIEGMNSLKDPEKEAIFHLISNGFSNMDASKIYNKFKLETIEVGNSNPFKFYNDIYGISFDKVRSYASKKEFIDAENKFRESYLIYIINDYTFNSGDTYISKSELERIYRIDNLDEIIDISIKHNYVIKEEDRIYLYDVYYDELYISNCLKKYSNELIIDDKLINEGINNLENELNIKYDDKQIEAIKSFFDNGVSLIVGGPGSGKTTIVKAMAELFKRYLPFNNLIVVAPTGRAAKRINEICEIESKTIHSLLKWDKETNTFIFNVDNPIMYDAIIIDEFSMVDNELFASLLKASTNVKKICIIGDDNQLPSIRCGFVLNDLLSSNLFKTTYLVSNYRQNRGNEIIALCEDIKNNNFDISRYQNDITFYDINDSFSLVDLINKDLNAGYSLDDIQVLAPMYKGLYGIDKLNELLQNAFNVRSVDKTEKEFNKVIYREFDKILQLKNRPSDDVYNGDIGVLEQIDLKEKCFLVNYNDTYVLYNYDELIDITLAYAMSVHKSQGSEYQVVYFIVSNNNIHMLNRNLIYTAISRAKSKLVIIGDKRIIKEGISRLMRKRNTTLLKRLKDEE